MMRPRILVAEDNSAQAIAFAAHLEKAGYEPVIAESGAALLSCIENEGPFGALLLDLGLPDADGLTLLRNHAALLRRQPVVAVTGDASLNRAVEATRLGARDFLAKPVAGRKLVAVIEAALEDGPQPAPAASAASVPVPTRDRAPRAPMALAAARPAHGFIGTSPVMREIYREIACIAPSRAAVLITGESGTGKEVAAEAIHHASGRGQAPFIAVNCGAIPENLLESELFGHLKGSFTGAVADRVGAVQAADGGTLFLDEIGEMALALQVKLLRFLQTGTVQRVGSTRAEPVDVRIVCATNRDPLREVAEGRFREDLYYRLAVLPIHMPPLRERAGAAGDAPQGGDVALLAEAFLQRFAAEEGKRFAPLGPQHIAALAAYPWPGNVRELQNVMRRAAVLFDGPELPLRALPAVPPSPSSAPAVTLVAPAAPSPSPALSPAPARAADTLRQALAGMTLDEIERIAVEGAIDAAQGSLPGAARILGVSPSTLYRKRERWEDARAAG